MSRAIPHHRAIVLVCLVLAAGWGRGAAGGEAAEGDPQAARLRRALEAVRKETAAAKARMAREEAARSERVRRLEAKHKELSDQVVDLRVAVAGLRRDEAAARKALEGLEPRGARVEQDRAKLLRNTRDALGRLRGHLQTLVPSSSRDTQLAEADRVAAELEANGAQADTLSRFLALLGELLAEGRGSERYETALWTARGEEENVTVVRIGHVAAAYLAAGDRVGLAVRSPGGEGYRWRERLPGSVRAAAREAAGRLEGGAAPGSVVFPSDVTRSLSEEQEYGGGGLWERAKAGGVVMIPLGAVAGLALVLIIERLLFFSREARSSDLHAHAVLEHCSAGDLTPAENYCRRHRGPLVRALGACLAHRREGVVAMEDAVQEAVLHEVPRLERFFPTLGMLATVAPLLGLLGTVTGMIRTFDMITMHGAGEPRLMAGGISEALTTTATGLIIAIPILLVHNALSGKMEKVVADTERYAASLLVLLRSKGLAQEAPHEPDGDAEAADARPAS